MQGRTVGLRALMQAGRFRRRLFGPPIWAVLFGLFFFLLSPRTLANPFTELSSDFWAFDAMNALVSSGLMTAQDLLDHGAGDSVMRFEVALPIARVVRTLSQGAPAGAPLDLEARLAAYQVGVAPRTRQLTAAEREAVHSLVAEFRPELEVLGLSIAGPEPTAPTTPEPEPLPLASTSAGSFVDLDVLLEDGTQVAAEPGPGRTPSSESTVLPALPALPVPEEVTPLSPVAATDVPLEVAETNPPTVPAESQAPASPATAAGLAPSAPTPFPTMVSADAPPVPAASGVATLPEDALRRQGPGVLPGRVAVDTQSTYEAVQSSRPVLAVDAAVQAGQTRLPVPGVKVSVAPTVRVTSEVAPAGATQAQAGSVEVQATVKIAGMEMGASVKNVQALEPQAQENLVDRLRVGSVPEQSGIGLSLRLGQVALMTDFSKVRKDLGNTERRRSFGLGYTLGSTAVLRADYQLVDLDAIGSPKPRTDASVGVNVNVTRVASVSAGMTLEGMRSGLPTGSEGQRTTAGVELRLPWNTFATAGLELYRPSAADSEVPSQSAATVGLGYNFAPNGTLLVGYRLIDFGVSEDAPEKSRQQSLTAGVSLSF